MTPLPPSHIANQLRAIAFLPKCLSACALPLHFPRATLDSRSQDLLTHLPGLVWSSFDLLFMWLPEFNFPKHGREKTFSSPAWKIRDGSLSLTDARLDVPRRLSRLPLHVPLPLHFPARVTSATNVPGHTFQLLLYLCLPSLAGSLLSRLFPDRRLHHGRQNRKSALPTGLAWLARSHLKGRCGLRAHRDHPELGRGSAVREAKISLSTYFFTAEKRWVRAWTEPCSLFRGKLS